MLGWCAAADDQALVSGHPAVRTAVRAQSVDCRSLPPGRALGVRGQLEDGAQTWRNATETDAHGPAGLGGAAAYGAGACRRRRGRHWVRGDGPAAKVRQTDRRNAAVRVEPGIRSCTTRRRISRRARRMPSGRSGTTHLCDLSAGTRAGGEPAPCDEFGVGLGDRVAGDAQVLGEAAVGRQPGAAAAGRPERIAPQKVHEPTPQAALSGELQVAVERIYQFSAWGGVEPLQRKERAP